MCYVNTCRPFVLSPNLALYLNVSVCRSLVIFKRTGSVVTHYTWVWDGFFSILVYRMSCVLFPGFQQFSSRTMKQAEDDLQNHIKKSHLLAIYFLERQIMSYSVEKYTKYLSFFIMFELKV
jgi:hypothetical protein